MRCHALIFIGLRQRVMMMSINHPLMRYHGAKFRLAPWVISHFPPHKIYVEPFGGAAGVLLRKPASYSEVYNDLDDDIVNLMRVLRDHEDSTELMQQLALTPYSRTEFNDAFQPTDNAVEQARRTLIRAHMGFGSAGATKGHTGFRIDVNRDYGTPLHLFRKCPETLQAVIQRLLNVLIENRPAVDVMDSYDSADTLHYVDPPYLPSTRQTGRCYRHEMTVDDHVDLLNALTRLEGMAVLSGYDSELYNDMLGSWIKKTTTARISAGRGTSIKTECLWINPAAVAAQRQMKLI